MSESSKRHSKFLSLIFILDWFNTSVKAAASISENFFSTQFGRSSGPPWSRPYWSCLGELQQSQLSLK